MLKIAAVALLCVLLSANTMEDSTIKNEPLVDSYPQKEICVANATDVNRKGCCSRHGGICGCEGKRMKCCDDTLSPTCKCGE